MNTDLLTATYPALPIDGAARPSRKLRVCIASFDFVGPVRNGGVGTAFTSLAEALAAAGHEVTLLYVSGQWCENGHACRSDSRRSAFGAFRSSVW